MPEMILFWLLGIFLALSILIELFLLVGALVLVVKVRQGVASAQKAAEPVVRQAKEAVSEVTAAARELSERARRIATITEQTAGHIAERVESTANLIQESITAPVISVSSALSGLRRGLEVWRQRAQRPPRSAAEPPRERRPGEL